MTATTTRWAPGVMGEMTLRALLRRRTVLLVMVALPLVFYLVRRDAVGQSVRSLLFGVSWAISTVAYFAAWHLHLRCHCPTGQK